MGFASCIASLLLLTCSCTSITSDRVCQDNIHPVEGERVQISEFEDRELNNKQDLLILDMKLHEHGDSNLHHLGVRKSRQQHEEKMGANRTNANFDSVFLTALELPSSEIRMVDFVLKDVQKSEQTFEESKKGMKPSVPLVAVGLLVIGLAAYELGRSPADIPGSEARSWGYRLIALMSPLVYIVFQTLADVATSWSHNSERYNFDAALIVACAELIKMALNYVFYCRSKANRTSEEQAEEEDGLFKIWYTMLVPGLLYMTIDVLYFVVLSHVSLVHYRVWYTSRLLWATLLWSFVFKVNLGIQKLFAVSLLLVACVLNVFGEESMSLASFLETALKEGAPWIVLISSLHACAGVSNEWAMKVGVKADIHLQNIGMYLTSGPCALAVWLIFGSYSARSNFNIIFGFLVCCQVSFGYAASFMIRYSSVITKNFAHAMVVPCSLFAGSFALGLQVSYAQAGSGFVVFLATLIYSWAPVAPATGKK